MQKTTLYLVRHGQSEANRDELTCGKLDSPLTELGKKQAIESRDALKNILFHEVYSSSLKRAIETAEIISGKAVPPSRQIKELDERSFGKLEGKSEHFWVAIYRSFEEKYSGIPTHEKWEHRYAPDIESNGELSKRFLEALGAIAQENKGKTILVGTHAGCIRTTLIKLGYLNENQLPPNSFANTGYVVMSFDDNDVTIEKVNGVITP